MSNGRGLLIGTAVVLVGLAAAVAFVTRERPLPALRQGGTLTVANAMSGSTEGYARAVEPRDFHFPEDHGPHPEFRTEWWYWTGNLETEDGRAFGYQFTLFRNALAPETDAAPRDSAWGARQVYMGHFTVTDVAGGTFHASERFSRVALGLSGATARPFKVWLENWETASVDASATWPMRLRAQTDDVALELLLEPGKTPVLHGERGLSQKSAERGNASYYYSMTRMPSRGTVRVGDKSYTVKGNSWMDREWSTSALGADQVGWDWFSLQLSDGSELMYYQLRHRDGTPDAYSSGLWVPPDGAGEPVHLRREDMKLTVLDTWKSPRSGGAYPSRWRMQVERLGLDLTVTPRLADQELPVTVLYWEGTVGLEGSRQGQPVSGRGYVELTGYADTQGPRRRESQARGTPDEAATQAPP